MPDCSKFTGLRIKAQQDSRFRPEPAQVMRWRIAARRDRLARNNDHGSRFLSQTNCRHRLFGKACAGWRGNNATDRLSPCIERAARIHRSLGLISRRYSVVSRGALHLPSSSEKPRPNKVLIGKPGAPFLPIRRFGVALSLLRGPATQRSATAGARNVCGFIRLSRQPATLN